MPSSPPQQAPRRPGGRPALRAPRAQVSKLCDLVEGDVVTSVSWSQRGTYVSVGCGSGKVQIWDAARMRLVRTMEGHRWVARPGWGQSGRNGGAGPAWEMLLRATSAARTPPLPHAHARTCARRARVGTMAWGAHVLSSGSRDRTILQRDVRAPEHFSAKLQGHRSEICGLKVVLRGRCCAPLAQPLHACVRRCFLPLPLARSTPPPPLPAPSGPLTTASLPRAATTTCCWCGSWAARPLPCASRSTRRPSRPSRGRRTSTGCWPRGAARRTAASGSGTRPAAQR